MQMKPVLCFPLFISPSLPEVTTILNLFIRFPGFLYTSLMNVCIPLAINTIVLFISKLYIKSISTVCLFLQIVFPLWKFVHALP